MTVRPATPGDAYQIAEAHITSWQSAYRGIIPDHMLEKLSIERRAEIWENSIKTGTDIIYVYQDEEDVVGFIGFGPSRDEGIDKSEVAEIYAIYLAPHRYRKGFGTKLMKSALDLLRKQAYKKVTLWVLDENTSGRKFYEKLGFAESGETKTDEFKDGTKMFETQYFLNLT